MKTAGVIVVRQSPGTTKGSVFLSLGDETGTCQAIVRPDLFRENRALAIGTTSGASNARGRRIITRFPSRGPVVFPGSA